MSKTLGLDLGTNSIGWAIVEDGGNEHKLIDRGVYIFSEGVKIEKGVESSKAAERTGFRLARRQKFRRRLRKYETLKVLIENNMCPLTIEDLEKWAKYKKREKREYPKNKEFLDWLKTDEATNKNPYYFRSMSVKNKLPLYDVGRALYHIAQRRGYKSNRLETTKENDDGKVASGIGEINKNLGEFTLGEYFYELYKKGEKIRSSYTSREQHYLTEFKKICDIQQFSKELSAKLEKAIFFQRPLKSQKGLVGKCVFEKSKPRCPISHPLFEEFRALQFINSIKIKNENRFLTNEEKILIKPLFLRKSKPNFDFEEIRKKLLDKNENKEFNYTDWTLVSGCPTISQLIDVFGDDWININFEYIREKDNKKSIINYETIWHVLFNFDSVEKIKEFGINRLKLDEDKSNKLSKIKLKQGYGSLSLCAIRKILPYLKEGLLYSYSAYFANLGKVVDDKNKNKISEIKEDIKSLIEVYKYSKKVENIINSYIYKYRENHFSLKIEKKDFINKLDSELGNDFILLKESERITFINEYFSLLEKMIKKNDFIKIKRLDEKIIELLKNKYDIPEQNLSKLFHPSDLDIYPDAKLSPDGKKYLGSPRTQSVRNPMAMKTLHQLKKLINTLLKEDKISSGDTINIELARELNDANMRAAIKRYQSELEKNKKEYAQKIKDTLNIAPSETDILKYQLWEEQQHMCLYTGKEISISDFLSENPAYDIEHTIPRSLSFDDSQVNLTLCHNDFNRNIKKNMIPQQLPNIEEILLRIEHWKEEYQNLEKQISKARKSSKNSSAKEEKDRAIQWKNYLILKRDYLKQKYERFLLKDIPSGFTNRQLRDTAIITKYARAYLKTVFDDVSSIKGSMTAQFRKIWGVQNEYEIKSRSKHSHHTVDAIVLASISRPKYNMLSTFYNDTERGLRPTFKKPWATFVEDIKKIEDEIIVKHYFSDNTLKQSKKKLRIRGKIKYNSDKNPLYQKGNSFRGSLHLETYYGAIKRKDENNNGKIAFVVRKPLNSLKNEKEIDNIVDAAVRNKVKTEIEQRIQNGKKFNEAISETIWMNEEKKIPIKKVRIYSYFENCVKLKEHIFLSNKEYKKYTYVANDSNYAMTIYHDKSNSNIRNFTLYSNLDISKKGKFEFPKENKGLILKYVLKQGLSVILYENNPDEIYNLQKDKIHLYLYKIIGLYKDNGRIQLKNNLEASENGKLPLKKGEFSFDGQYYPLRNLMYKQFNALIENVDFQITNDGKIKFIF